LDISFPYLNLKFNFSYFNLPKEQHTRQEVAMMVYFSLRPEPMATIICWNLFFFFAGLNIGQIGWFFLKKRKADLVQRWKNCSRENLQLIGQSLSGTISVFD
tara:strand:- start:1030 stop:1335 length:306 start_codon:yes stop_codon:yes gene_type:complete